ncbi:SLC13 family permease [Treponema brennaborense]|uniref:Citrate transporter n=1 Tax=Treponema brennaborense (strain DSM 12168 / CIP 105900 / DD5/3) TaxID=906968 RepID=F4LNM4_TREBD|nr:SLC13 family permease [Treponema brennaborense]AEE15878.1 Citrate transporter [Treponema brennaborense DSM 12168]
MKSKNAAAWAAQFVKREAVLCAAVVLAAVSTCVVRPSLAAVNAAIDRRVLALLFCLMLIIQAFRSLSVLDAAADFLLKRCAGVRSVYAAFVALIFASSLFVTNDVALLTFVPVSLAVCRRSGIDPVPLVILETLAANLGSCVTPMGNPQNLFLYSFYRMEPAAYTVALAVILLAVFRVVDYPVCMALSAAVVAVCNFRLFARVDYGLLLTFAAFFLFTENISLLPDISAALQSALDSRFAVYMGGIAASQVISNVPAALLLSGFTDYGRELLLGVNVGGLGTLIASLASVISYKLYSAAAAETEDARAHGSGRYLLQFTVYNLIFLAVLIPLVYVLSLRG